MIFEERMDNHLQCVLELEFLIKPDIIYDCH